MSFGGRAASSSGCAITKGHETGSTGYIGRTPSSSPTGLYVMATAEHREPCESRGSGTVLGAPGVKLLRATRYSRRLRGSCRESAHPSIADVMLQHTVNGEKPAGALPIVRASPPCSKSSAMRMPFLPRCAPEIFPVARRAACSILTRCGTRWIAQGLWRATSNVVKGPFYFEPYEADRPASSADRAPGRSNGGSRRSPHR
jgi:hypothetical protein